MNKILLKRGIKHLSAEIAISNVTSDTVNIYTHITNNSENDIVVPWILINSIKAIGLYDEAGYLVPYVSMEYNNEDLKILIPAKKSAIFYRELNIGDSIYIDPQSPSFIPGKYKIRMLVIDSNEIEILVDEKGFDTTIVPK